MFPTTGLPTRPSTFDLLSSPLEGLNLIDASAGTGKTYTICGLVLRLLIEKHLPIEQILVVTYTEAATEDLRDRIRKKLRQALQAIDNPPGDDTFLQKYLAELTNPQEAARRLSEALRSFDEAAIFTIHGFCQRMLNENSFESKVLFDTELVTDDSYLIKDIVEDFWRQVSSQHSALFSQYAVDTLTPQKLMDFLSPLLPYPFLHFIPAIDFVSGCSSFSDIESEYGKVYSSVCREWSANRNEVVDDLIHSPRLKRNIYTMASIRRLVSAMDEMAAAKRPSPHLFEKFTLLTASKITAATKVKESPLILPIYELCEQLMLAKDTLCAQYDRCFLAIRKKLLDSFRQELNRRKERENVISFDDLLRRLHKALTGPGGTVFARTAARKYPAVLIDEFQDTDPLQFEIFKTIYREHSLLFLIGDPKQAIYSFRGADIFTYLDAAAASPLAHHTLGVNHRSTPELVNAVNTIFDRAQHPFIFETISFQPVSAAEKPDPGLLIIDGQQEEPFILWYLQEAQGASDNAASEQEQRTKISKNAARRRIISWVGAEVVRLLNLAAANRLQINNRNLMPGDIAILVRKNDEARKMQQVLTGMRVQNVVHSGDDLFASDEAKEMFLLLSAVLLPGNIRRAKRGLLTRFFDIPADALIMLDEQINPALDKFIGQWMTRYRRYHALWSQHGFIRMFWAVMQENRVRQRLLKTKNGERSLTNILHLAEILHQESMEQGLNMSALLGFLQERLAEAGPQKTEHQLRLETDADRVKIVTIHKAKGLEYSVVFCPFLWEGVRIQARKGCLFHQQRDGLPSELVYDAGSPELAKHLHMAQQEEMAETLRLLYVALTRAVHRCYIAWGRISGAETSGLAYLLHQPAKLGPGTDHADFLPSDLMRQVRARFLELTDHEIVADLEELAALSGGTIRITMGEEPAGTYMRDKDDTPVSLRHRELAAAIARDWRISSFSSLSAPSETFKQAGHLLHDMAPDRDGFSVPAPLPEGQPEQSEQRYDIFSFPQGTRPGTLLHDLLEQADFTAPQPVTEQIICEKLLQFGYDTNWLPVIGQMLVHLSNVRLHENIPGLHLANISRASCLPELEFYFPLASLTPSDLRMIFCAKAPDGYASDTVTPVAQQLERLAFAPTGGFMRGFIDLVFEFQGKYYIVDWKSNHLGAQIDDYRQDKLSAAILSGLYFLQYHIYCLALHLYLDNRLPGYCYEDHFGGVFYVFLRGVRQELGPRSGIFYDLPSLPILERFYAKLLTETKTGPAILKTGKS